MDTKEERGELKELGDWDWHIYTNETMYKVDNYSIQWDNYESILYSTENST